MPKVLKSHTDMNDCSKMVDEKISHLEQLISQVSSKIEYLSSLNSNLETKINHLQNQISHPTPLQAPSFVAANIIDELDDRKHSIIFFNLPEPTSQSCDVDLEYVTQLCKITF